MEKTTILIIIASVSVFLSFCSMAITFQANGKLKRMKQRYDKMLRGADDINIETALSNNGRDIDKILESLEKHDKVMARIERSAGNNFSKCHMIRYNAYPTSVEELSFSLCLLNSNNDGFILTNIFSTDSSSVYAIDVINGGPQRSLSKEEHEVLKQAVEQ